MARDRGTPLGYSPRVDPRSRALPATSFSPPCPVPIQTIEWVSGPRPHARLIEQTRLPVEVVYLDVYDVSGMVDAIYRLAVRGAPAIGVAAAYGVLLGVQGRAASGPEEFMAHLADVSKRLAAARPTAVNLFWALERMSQRARAERARSAGTPALIAALFDEAHKIQREDKEQCDKMGQFGAELIRDGMRLLTHCNAGALATAGIGTALAPMYTAHAQGKRIEVFADETRPLLQGARLTAFELHAAGIPVTLITDNMAGRVMSEGRIDAVFVGSDRIAANGDVCNKIGTYSVAVLARHHGIPFYVVAPLSTFDLRTPTGKEIPIEERGAEEVTHGFGRQTAPSGVRVYNPAFDVTPAALVSGIITEVGLIEAPNNERLREAFRRAGRPL
jgi:methylthioribose-1-phosphate isomerase